MSQKAREIVRGGGNAYDSATLIEAYLRTFPVDTKIEPAPPKRDSVAYFLFDVGRSFPRPQAVVALEVAGDLSELLGHPGQHFERSPVTAEAGHSLVHLALHLFERHRSSCRHGGRWAPTAPL